MLLQRIFYLFDIELSSQFALQRCDIFIVDSARDDMPKIAEVHVHIKGESVHSYPSRGAYAHRTYFTGVAVVSINPNAGISFITAGLYAVPRAGAYHRLLQRT